VVSLFIFGADSQSLVGSVVASVHMAQEKYERCLLTMM
jgi:hypothetical protein